VGRHIFGRHFFRGGVFFGGIFADVISSSGIFVAAYSRVALARAAYLLAAYLRVALLRLAGGIRACGEPASGASPRHSVGNAEMVLRRVPAAHRTSVAAPETDARSAAYTVAARSFTEQGPLDVKSFTLIFKERGFYLYSHFATVVQRRTRRST